jgi:uncharacterized membrane protein
MAAKNTSSKSAPANPWTDQHLETLVGQLLRFGVLLSAAVVFIGGIIYLVRHRGSLPDYSTFHGEPDEVRSINRIVRYAWAGHGRGMIQLGLLLLIATPVARVILAIIGFAKERDHLYTIVSSIVFVILLYSLLVSA